MVIRLPRSHLVQTSRCHELTQRSYVLPRLIGDYLSKKSIGKKHNSGSCLDQRNYTIYGEREIRLNLGQ